MTVFRVAIMAAKNESDSEHQSLSSLAQTLDSKISLESGKSVYTIESVYYDSGSSYDYETEVEGKHYGTLLKWFGT